MVVGKAHVGAGVFVLGEKVGVEQERMSSTSASVPSTKSQATALAPRTI